MLTKYANHEAILDIKTASERLEYEPGEGAMLAKFAKTLSEPEVDDGYVYVRTRAISSRVNKNNDGWPSEELAKSYKSFIGRPVFVDHNNSDPKRTRGVIVDAKLHVEDEKTSALDPYYSSAPDNHKPPTWVELLIEVDGKTYPKLAGAIKTGDIDATSMGANIEKSICSVCGNEAAVPEDYCNHIKSKGATFEVTADNGEKLQKRAYEDCYGVNFFEDSFVFDPADETALNIGVDDKPSKLAASEPNGDRDIYDARTCPKCGGSVTPNNDTIGVEAECGKCGSVYKAEEYDHLPKREPYDNPNQVGLGFGYGKRAFFGIPNQNLFNWFSGVGVLSAYGAPFVRSLIHRLANGEPPAEVFEDLDPEIRARIEASIEAGNLQNLRPFDHEKETVAKTAGISPALIKAVDDYHSLLNSDEPTSKIIEKVVNDTAGTGMKPVVTSDDDVAALINDYLYGYGKTSFSKVAELEDVEDRELNYEPQSDMVTSPMKVDTLQDDIKCPNCKVDVLEAGADGILTCPTCHYEQPPEGLDNPDLSKAQQIDKDKVLDGDTGNGDVIRATDEDADDSQDFIKPLTQDNKQSATNSNVPTGVISEMKWDTKIATNSATEANGVLRRVLAGAVETTIEYGGGIHFGTAAAMKTAGLHATIKYPALPQPIPLPGNDIQHFMAAAQSMEQLGLTDVSQVPITVEASDEELDRVLAIIHNGGDEKTASVKEATEKTAGVIEIPYPGGMGIHNGTSAAFQQAGISATVTAPGAPMPLTLPFAAANAFVMIKMLESQGFFVEGNPVQVESENPDLAARLIELNSTSQHPVVAANEKTPAKKNVILPAAQSKGDAPVEERVIADQLQPVTADRRVIKREETPDGHRTEQIVEETGDLLGDDQTKDEKKDDKPAEEKVNTEQPRSQKERSDGGESESDGQEDNRPDFLKKKPVAASAEERLLAAISVAEQAVEMGVIPSSKKMAFVGMLEDKSIEDIEARRETLNLVKSSGLTKKTASKRVVSSLPRLGYNETVTSSGDNLADIPVEAIFM